MDVRPIKGVGLHPVPNATPAPATRGRALVLGALPPISGASALQAAVVVHMMKSAGYEVSTATGPGLAMARHQINFASETRYRNSAMFINRIKPVEAVVYARVFDFSRISKPYWYKRRLEEVRRIRLLVRTIRNSGRTTLILDGSPKLSRMHLTQWLTARIAGLAFRKPVKVYNKSIGAGTLIKAVTGKKMAVPDTHVAEETTYAEAFESGSARQTVRLTVLRAEQALSYWTQRIPAEEASRLATDIRQIIDVTRRHDLRDLPQFRLLFGQDGLDSTAIGATLHSKPEHIANMLHPISEKLRVPITRYMMHLRASCHVADRFPLSSRAEGRKFLTWYLQEAPAHTPEGWVPLPSTVRDFLLETRQGGPRHDIPNADPVILHAIGRDRHPFALSPRLAAYYAGSKKMQTQFDITDPVDRLGFLVDVMLSLPDRKDAQDIAGPAAGYLTAPIGGNPANASRLEFLIALQARYPMDGEDRAQPPWAQPGLKQWVRRASTRAFPAALRLLPQVERTKPARATTLLTGLPKSETGVGSNVQMSRKALSRARLAPILFDAADGMATISRPPEMSRVVRRNVALHHLNADRIPQALLSPTIAQREQTYNIGFLLWEFDALPDAHRLALDLLDEIWTPSRFLRQAYARHTDRPVINMMKGLDIPHVEPMDRATLHCPEDATLFLTCFDFHSSVARKNPLAAVTCFQAAFPQERKDVRLIVKTTPTIGSHWGDPERQMDRIRSAAAMDPRITIIEAYLPFTDLLSLIATSDCLISPHRAEGFGLMPAYALGLGRSVVATNYSGTTDFCTKRTAFPVPFRKTGITEGQALYPMKDASWAEIDHDALTETLRSIASNPSMGQERAEAGRALIMSRYSSLRQAVRYRRRLADIGVI